MCSDDAKAMMCVSRNLSSGIVLFTAMHVQLKMPISHKYALIKQYKIIFLILSLSIFCVTNWEVCIKHLEVHDTMEVPQKMKSKTTM